MDFLQSLVAIILAQTGLLAAAIYFARAILQQVLARDIENHKHALARDFERYKRNLDALQFERQTKFSLMHEKSAEVIARLYGMLADAHRKITHMTRLMKSVPVDEEERKKQANAERNVAAEAFNALDDYFAAHRIFLSEGLAKKCDDFISQLKSSYIDFEISQVERVRDRIDHKLWLETWKRLSNELPPLLDDLRKEFRSALGVVETGPADMNAAADNPDSATTQTA